MKLKRKVIAILAILAALLTGCISQPPPEKVTFVFGSSGDAVRLDPADVTDGESIQRMDNIHEGLVEYEEGTTSIRPCLATDWEISADKLTITFNLRKGVQFHHGYGEMTADDVVFSFARQYDSDNWYHDKGEWAYWGYMFTDVDYVEKIDDYKVALHLKRPNASIMTSLAMFTVCIVSEDAAKDYGDDYFANPVGTGPFEFVEWIKDDTIKLRAFEDYWRDRAKIDELIFKVIPDPSARLMALQAGEVHGIEHVDPQHISIIQSDPKLQLISQAGMNVGYVALNCGEGYVDANENGKWDSGEEGRVPGAFVPFEDIRVRRAIAHAINKQAIVDNLYQGAASVAVQGMPPSLFGYNHDIEGYEYDPAKARQLLADAGYPDGFDVTFWHMPVSRPYFPVPTEIAEAIQADLAAIGINATLFTEDWGTYLQDTEAGKHHMAMLGWTGDNGDPDNFLNVLYSQDKATIGTAGNIGFKKNQKFQDLLDKALATYDQDQRAAYYEEANVLLVDQCSHVFIAHSDQNLGFLASVKGYIIHPTSRKFFYPVWLEDEDPEYLETLAESYEDEAREYENAGEYKEAAEAYENAAIHWEKASKAWGNPIDLEKALYAMQRAAEAWRNAARDRGLAGDPERQAEDEERAKRADQKAEEIKEKIEEEDGCWSGICPGTLFVLLLVIGDIPPYLKKRT